MRGWRREEGDEVREKGPEMMCVDAGGEKRLDSGAEREVRRSSGLPKWVGEEDSMSTEYDVPLPMLACALGPVTGACMLW